jgi:hypothetical protein
MSFNNLGSCSIARFFQKNREKYFTDANFFSLNPIRTHLIKFTSVCILIFHVVEKQVFIIVKTSDILYGRKFDFLASRHYRRRIYAPLFVVKIIAYFIAKSCV